MSQNYTPEFKKKIVRLHEEEGRTYKSITAEYDISKASISKWCSELRQECRLNPQAQNDYDSMKENLRLKKENEELKKEVLAVLNYSRKTKIAPVWLDMCVKIGVERGKLIETLNNMVTM